MAEPERPQDIAAAAPSQGELPEPEPTRPIFALGRVAEGGKMRLDLVLDFARLSLGRDPTPEEVAEARRYWAERFPDQAHEEPTAE